MKAKGIFIIINLENNISFYVTLKRANLSILQNLAFELLKLDETIVAALIIIYTCVVLILCFRLFKLRNVIERHFYDQKTAYRL